LETEEINFKTDETIFLRRAAELGENFKNEKHPENQITIPN
jgi:hypothetical protein